MRVGHSRLMQSPEPMLGIHGGINERFRRASQSLGFVSSKEDDLASESSQSVKKLMSFDFLNAVKSSHGTLA